MRSILVPLDGSRAAEQAISPALGIARRTRAAVTLVAVHQPVAPPIGPRGAPVLDSQFDIDQREHLERYLDDLRDRATTVLTGLPVDRVVLEGVAGEQLARFAEASSPDLVVMASHGRGGPSRWWLGSVTDHLVRAIALPILVIRSSTAPDAYEPTGEFRRVVVALDGSDESERVISQAREVAGDGTTEYTLLRVIAPRITLGMVDPYEMNRDAERQKAVARQYLDAVTSRLGHMDINVRSAIRMGEQPATAICHYADDISADLIVLATHARQGVGRFLLGSVADKVMRAATVPVLLCHLIPAGHVAPNEGGEAMARVQPLF